MDSIEPMVREQHDRRLGARDPRRRAGPSGVGEPFDPGCATLAIHRVLQEAFEHGGRKTRAVVTMRWTASGVGLGGADDGICTR